MYMKQLFSPWRSQYIAGINSNENTGSNFMEDASRIISIPDYNNLVVYRSEYTFVMMNRFPYNAGHLMVIPIRKVSTLSDMNIVELADLSKILQLSERVLQRVYTPQGINIGANIGAAAGAGVPDYLHFHVLPRWNGDTNFLPVLADVKIISESFEDSFNKIAAAFLSESNSEE